MARKVYLAIVDYSYGSTQDLDVYNTLLKAKRGLKAKMEEIIAEGSITEKPSTIRKMFRENDKMFFDIDQLDGFGMMQCAHGYILERNVL